MANMDVYTLEAVSRLTGMNASYLRLKIGELEKTQGTPFTYKGYDFYRLGGKWLIVKEGDTVTIHN